MRRLLPALAAWLFSALVAAQPAPLEREGYAFDAPRILAQQRLFGIAHGVALLATACRAVPETASAAEAAYALWRVREQAAIDAAAQDLGEYFFGNRETDWQTIARKMLLKESLDLPGDSEQLAAACASLPEALQQPRYELSERFHLEELMAQVVAAAELEARERHCRGLFPEAFLPIHEARYEGWREINAPLLAQALKELAERWPADAPAPSFDEWYAELRRRTQAAGNLRQCIAFSESLKRPEAALRNVFGMPPPLLQSTPSK
ncbi:MAG: hypothetical protein ACM3Y9_10250 [Ignavibacteria bacterium]